MEDQVPIKVFTIWRCGETPEVRRFGIEKSLITSFLYLNAKLQEIYPALKDKSYSVTWQDEEGDDVTISSDEEVMTALTAMHGSLIKLYVHVATTEPQEDDADIVITAFSGAGCGNNAVHYGVRCDGCDSAVVGFRYKCTACADFDLCSKCEAAGLHPEHCMVRVPTPTMPRTLIKAAIKRSRHFLKSVAGAVGEDCPYKKNRRGKGGDCPPHEGEHRGPHHSGDHHGPPHGGDHHRSPHGGDNHGPPHSGDHHGPHHDRHHHRERHHRRSGPSWLQTFATYMNEFADLAGDMAPDSNKNTPEGPKEQSQSQTQEQQKTSSDANAEAPRQREACTSNPDMLQCPFVPENLNLQGVQKMIELYFNGNLNLNSFVPSPAPSAACSTDASVNTTVNTNNASVDTNDVEMEQEARAPEPDKVSIKSEASSSSAESKRDESPDKSDSGWTVINEEREYTDAYGNPSGRASEPSAPIGFNLSEEFQDCVRISEGQTLYPPLNIAAAVLNPQELGSPLPAFTQPQQPLTQPQQPLTQPQQPLTQPQQPSTQPRQPLTQPQQTLTQPQQPFNQPQQPLTQPQQPLTQPQQPFTPRLADPKPQPAPAQERPAPRLVNQPPPQPRQRHPKPHIDAAIVQMLTMGFSNDGGWLTQLLESKDGNIAAVLDILTPVNTRQ